MNTNLRIKASIVWKMADHAVEELPNECCGMLSGKSGFIDGIHVCTNHSASPSEFFIPPRELFSFFRFLQQEGKDLMGIYHSHPKGPETPSLRDEQEFYYRNTSYWIVSLNNESASVRCFEWGREGFVEVPFIVREG